MSLGPASEGAPLMKVEIPDEAVEAVAMALHAVDHPGISWWLDLPEVECVAYRFRARTAIDALLPHLSSVRPDDGKPDA